MKCIHLAHRHVICGWYRVQSPKSRDNKQTTYWQHTHTYSHSILGLKLWSTQFLPASCLSLILRLPLSLTLCYFSLKFSIPLWQFCGLLCVVFCFFFCLCFFFFCFVLEVVKKSTFWLLRLGAHLVVTWGKERDRELKNCILLLIGALLFSTLYTKHTHECMYLCVCVSFKCLTSLAISRAVVVRCRSVIKFSLGWKSSRTWKSTQNYF